MTKSLRTYLWTPTFLSVFLGCKKFATCIQLVYSLAPVQWLEGHFFEGAPFHCMRWSHLKYFQKVFSKHQKWQMLIQNFLRSCWQSRIKSYYFANINLKFSLMGSLSSMSEGSCDLKKMVQVTLWVIWEILSMFEGLNFYSMPFDCP